MSECIRGSYDDALYKPTYTLRYFTVYKALERENVHWSSCLIFLHCADANAAAAAIGLQVLYQHLPVDGHFTTDLIFTVSIHITYMQSYSLS